MSGRQTLSNPEVPAYPLKDPLPNPRAGLAATVRSTELRLSGELVLSVQPLRPDELGDVLVDPNVDLRVRRRIPALLAADPSRRAVEVLTVCITDRRFEVRYRCGRALARLLVGSPGLTVDPGIIFDAVRREAALGRHVWESQRLLDRLEKTDEDSFVDEFLRNRAGRSLEHAFTLLSLVLPREPLQIAFRSLQTDDQQMQGTALEYLDGILPARIRERLWPYLEHRPMVRSARPREEVIAELLRSHRSITLNLESLYQRNTASAPTAG